MLPPFKRIKHQQFLLDLPKLAQSADEINILLSATQYRQQLLELIANAKKRIYLIALYLEHDDAGHEVLQALYQAKAKHPQLEIAIFVDWHRAQRGRIGEGGCKTNADWYCEMLESNPQINVPVYGVPINTREVLGVLHLKGSIIDDSLLYTGASINDVYLHKNAKYRYDRYQIITNPALAESMVEYVKQHILPAAAIQNLDCYDRPQTPEIKQKIRQFRADLCSKQYQFTANANNDELSLTPIAGLGKGNTLNQTIHHLMNSTDEKMVICTPYFNLPSVLVKNVIRLLRRGKKIEIIIGDKTANDFYIPEDQPFKVIGALPYLYEINLRNFAMKLQHFIDNEQLTIRLWKDQDNSYHLKGIWVDNEWMLLTGNNLNPRAWRLDLENAILIHDPQHQLAKMKQQELNCIRENTFLITHYQQLQASQFYPEKIRKLIHRLSRIRVDKLIRRIL